MTQVLSCGTTPSKGAACSALVESTFRNAENALLVAKTPGLLQVAFFLRFLLMVAYEDSAHRASLQLCRLIKGTYEMTLRVSSATVRIILTKQQRYYYSCDF